MTKRHVVLALGVALLTVACDGPSTPDAGADASIDAGARTDAGRDAGPACTLECSATETCCLEPDGAPVCTSLRTDPRHCGLCQTDCVTTHRGDGCDAHQCTCGSSTIGCTGNRQSWCCPPRAPGTEAYCTDLDTSPADCGECNVGCSALTSNRCDGGHCVCGLRAACAGTPDSVCCTAGADTSCVDTTSDRFHCGGCNHVCAGAERCEEGTCTQGSACAAGCSLSETCCNGTCCARDRCIAGVCGA